MLNSERFNCRRCSIVLLKQEEDFDSNKHGQEVYARRHPQSVPRGKVRSDRKRENLKTLTAMDNLAEHADKESDFRDFTNYSLSLSSTFTSCSERIIDQSENVPSFSIDNCSLDSTTLECNFPYSSQNSIALFPIPLHWPMSWSTFPMRNPIQGVIILPVKCWFRATRHSLTWAPQSTMLSLRTNVMKQVSVLQPLSSATVQKFWKDPLRIYRNVRAASVASSHGRADACCIVT